MEFSVIYWIRNNFQHTFSFYVVHLIVIKVAPTKRLTPRNAFSSTIQTVKRLWKKKARDVSYVPMKASLFRALLIREWENVGSI